jgi:hypothetical protein
MDSMQKRILFITGGEGPHPFHGELIKAIGADFYYTADKGYPGILQILKHVLFLPRVLKIYNTFTSTKTEVPSSFRLL